MNSLIDFIESPKDCAFRTFLDTVPSDIFDTAAADLVAMQLKVFGKCVKFDFDNLESVITAIGLSDDCSLFERCVNYYDLDADCCEHDLNLTDYSDASADFKDFLDDCVHYIANYFTNAGSMWHYQNFICNFHYKTSGNSDRTAGYTPQEALIYALLDLVVYAYILKRSTDYCECDPDLDDRLKREDFITDDIYYIPAIDTMEEIHADIIYNY